MKKQSGTRAGIANNRRRPSGSSSDHTAPVEIGPPPFPLKMVAMVAVKLLAADKLLPDPTPKIKGDPPDYDHAAFSAIRLLEACESRLNKHREVRRSMMDELHNASEITRKYPAGMPLKKALIRITGTRSEAEALPVFKMYLAQCVLPSTLVGLTTTDPDSLVERKLEELRKRKYNHLELSQEMQSFQEWKRATS